MNNRFRKNTAGDNKKVLIIGASGHGKVALDILQLMGRIVVGFLDDDPNKAGKKILGIPILGAVKDNQSLLDKYDYFVAIGDNKIRKKIVEGLVKFFSKYPINCIHPETAISKFASIGYGNLINCGVKVNAGVAIANGTIINTAAVVDHDAIIGDFVHVAPGATICGHVEIKDSVFVGTGSVVIDEIKIGADSIIGAASVVVEDIPSGVLAYGHPAKVIKNI